MMLKSRIFFFFLLMTCLKVNGQLTFTSNPIRLQLFPRNADDSATVVLSGNVTNPSWSQIIFSFRTNSTLIDSTVENLSFNNNLAPFAKSYRIKAQKSLYHFRLYLKNGGSTSFVLRADSVVCGDVYIIQGQSNATASATTSGYDQPYLWVRSFGNPTLTQSVALADTTWGIAQGNSGANPYSIGVWGLRLAKMLADTTSVPIAIINGSRPGTTINEHLPSVNPLNAATLFGRLLYRVQKAKVDQKIKAIFWYQGESDGDANNAPQYANRFGLLRTAWQTHYPGYQKLFVIQTRMGCVDNQPQHQQVRDAHRSFAINYPEVILMTSVGINAFDGCHLTVTGYLTLAGQLYKQLSREFYNKQQPISADPPKVLSAVFTNSTNTELSIIFNQPVMWPALFNGNDLKNYFYLNAPVTVLSGMSTGDTVKLSLSATSNAYKLSFMPNQYYNGTTTNYDGPWLYNTATVAAPTFYSFPVTANLIITAGQATLCSSGFVELTANKTGQTFQWFYNGNEIAGATFNYYTALQAGQYQLKMTDANGFSTFSNTFTVMQGTGITPDLVSSNGVFEFCAGGSMALLTSANAVSYLWNTGQNTAVINVSQPGIYSVTTVDSLGCIATSPSVEVIQRSSASVAVTANKGGFCPGDSLLLTSTEGLNYIWSTGATERSIYTTVPGDYYVLITDELGCTGVSDNFTVAAFTNPSAIISGATFACSGQSVTFTASGGSAYLWSTSQTTAGISVNQNGVYSVTVTDVNGCSANASRNFVSVVPQVTISPAGSTILCTTTKKTLTSTSTPAVAYQWYKNNAAISGATASSYQTGSTGTFYLRITDSVGCTANSPSTVVTSSPTPTASIVVTNQFDVCSDSIVTLTANSGSGYTYQWLKSSVAIPAATDIVYVTPTRGSFAVTVTTAAGCSKTSSSVSIPVTNVTASFVANGPTTFCNGDSVVLSANTGSGYTYQWQRAGVNIAGATNINYSAKTSGSYRVRVFNAMGCSATSSSSTITVNSCTRTINSALETSYQPEIKISVFPNPSSGNFTIESAQLDEVVNYRLLDISGRQVESGEMDLRNGTFTLGGYLQSGIYILMLEGNLIQQRFRLEKIRN